MQAWSGAWAFAIEFLTSLVVAAVLVLMHGS